MKVSPRFSSKWPDISRMKHVIETGAFNTTTPEGLPMITFRVEVYGATGPQALNLRMTVEETNKVIAQLQSGVLNAQKEVTA